MQIIIHGLNREPERFGAAPKETDLVIDINEDTVTVMIEEKIVSVTRSEFAAIQRLVNG